MQKDYLYELSLNLTEGVGPVIGRQLISYCGNAEAVFKTPKVKLLKIPSVGPAIVDRILNKENLIKAEKELQQIEQQQIKLLSYTDEDYPNRLKNLYDSPLLLYVKGEMDLNNPRSVAIVGTREASEYGKMITAQLVKQLKTFHPLIVSGLAYGIDIVAHRASLEQQLPTVGVMASGLNVIYPASHKKTVQQMLAQGGGIISENPLQTQPDAMRFPARNRIIAGLADAVIVVEAKKTGGALITAELANQYDREVFAIPGSIHSATSEGCHHLIKNHSAHLLIDTQDMELLLGWDQGKEAQPRQAKLNFEKMDLNENEKSILEIMKSQKKEMLLDEIGWKLQMPVQQLNACLLNLEINGLIRSLPGKKYALIY